MGSAGRVAYGLNQRVLSLCPGPSGWRVLTGGGSCLHVAAGAGGRRLVSYHSDGRAVAVWDAADGRELARHALPRGTLSAPCLGPDGRPYVALATGPAGETTFFGAEAGRAAAVLPLMGASGLWHPAFSPDGRLLASCNAPGVLRVWALPAAAGEAAVPTASATDFTRCAWLPGGELLTFSRRDGAVRVWPAGLLCV
jgi:hypothetical protein